MSNLKIESHKFAQVILGPPGSGKSTYCCKMYELLKQQSKRSVMFINLDPANENLTQTPDIDVMNLITVEDAMTNFSLGPNGALMVRIIGIYLMTHLITLRLILVLHGAA